MRGYLELERMRMENKFDFTITVASRNSPEEVLVPPWWCSPSWRTPSGTAGGQEKAKATLPERGQTQEPNDMDH
ncbi:MAG: hypothetical protein IPH00_07575 [Flavobacteriales bacterium]|nr:hypothetical protein [Flavobacteriales bacterium]